MTPLNVMAAVEAVSDDEWSLLLEEVDLKTPDQSGWHRYQRIIVVRGDAPAEFTLDLGPSDAQKVEQFRIPTYVKLGNGRMEATEKVGTVRDIAYWKREHPHAPIQPTNLMLIWAQEQDEKRRLRRGKSTFGHGGKKVRRTAV
jgi:hypothetical protein